MATVADAKDLSLEETLSMINTADMFKRQREDVERLLHLDQTREELKQKILAGAKATGKTITEEDALRAADSFLSGLYSFREPEQSASYKLSTMYADRNRIGRVYGTPALGITILGTLLWGVVTLAGFAGTAFAERNVEDQLMSACGIVRASETNLATLSSTTLEPDFHGDLVAVVNGATVRLEGLRGFKDRFCTDDNIRALISDQNYQAIKETELGPISPMLDAINADVAKANGIVSMSKDFTATRQGLNSLLEEIKSQNPPRQIAEAANSAYNSGMAALANKQIEQGKGYQKELGAIKANFQQFTAFPSQIEHLYSSIKATAKEDAAVRKADQLYGESQTYLSTVNIGQLKQVADQLKSLEAVLKQEYTVKVVNRSGVKSGIDRYYTDKSGKRISGFYLIVEAVDPKGVVVKVQITNAENGKTFLVGMWGERVPQSVYEQVKKDKQDDGIVQKNTVGSKQKGYLEYTVTMPGARKEGQITEW